MKYRAISIGILLSVAYAFMSNAQQDDWSVLKGPYLGQKPPGKIPIKFPFDFMPEGYRLHSAPVFTPDGEELYFSAMDFSVRYSEKIFVMKKVNGIWTLPRVAPFSGDFFDGSPSLSKDGRYLVFSSARKLEGDGLNESGARNIWYVERSGEGWSAPKPLNFQTKEWENGTDMSELGNLFFDSRDIYKIKFPPGEKDNPEKLGNAINSEHTELHPCVAPDERFIVFYSSRPGHYGTAGGDLYISFRKEDGTWKEATNLGGQFNKGHLSTSFPRLSPDGKYLFFLKLMAVPWQCEVYWVSVEALDELTGSFGQEDNFPALNGPYLGQKPPGMTPELFASGVVSSGMNESSLVFAPDYGEVYYDITHLTHRFTAIVCLTRENGIWQPPAVASFSGKFMDSSPFITRDNQKLFYCSNRPFKGEHDIQDFDLWYVQRGGEGWGDPINLGLHVNSNQVDVNPCVTENGTLYFASNREGSRGGHDIYKSLFIEGKYQKPVNLGEPINTSDFESSPYVSPDESYIIFNVFVGENSNRKSGLHVSFKTKNGSWSKPIYMGDTINMGGPSMFADVSPDGKYLFFTSQNVPYLPFSGDPLNYRQLHEMLTGPRNGCGDLYWVDAGIIEELKPKEFK